MFKMKNITIYRLISKDKRRFKIKFCFFLFLNLFFTRETLRSNARAAGPSSCGGERERALSDLLACTCNMRAPATSVEMGKGHSEKTTVLCVVFGLTSTECKISN